MSTPHLPAPQPAKNRLLITLVLDTSDSMAADDAIDELNRGLGNWREALNAQAQLRRMAEIALVSFGADGVRVVDPTGATPDEPDEPFVPVAGFRPPTLRAGGFSPMVPAINRTLSIVETRRTDLAGVGVGMAYRPLVFLMTDGAPSDETGAPTDSWRDLVPVLREQEGARRMLFFAFGVRGANTEVLTGLAPDGHFQIETTDFTALLTKVMVSIERAIGGGRNQSAAAAHTAIRSSYEQREKLHRWFDEQRD